jgi:hypothetical protein
VTVPGDFERDLDAWIDGELPADAAARMQAAVDASPELAERAALQRSLDARMRDALAAEPAAAAIVREMALRASGLHAPAARRTWSAPRIVSVAASLVIVAGVLLWTLCIGPFECRFLVALEKAADDPSALPGPAADELMNRSGLPLRVGDALAVEPVVALAIEFADCRTKGLRVDYARPDTSSFRVTASECPTKRPSSSRIVEWEGRSWWTSEYDGHRLVAFDRPGCDFVYCVVGPAGSDCVFKEAAALRDAIR